VPPAHSSRTFCFFQVTSGGWAWFSFQHAPDRVGPPEGSFFLCFRQKKSHFFLQFKSSTVCHPYFLPPKFMFPVFPREVGLSIPPYRNLQGPASAVYCRHSFVTCCPPPPLLAQLRQEERVGGSIYDGLPNCPFTLCTARVALSVVGYLKGMLVAFVC